ncbi:Gp150 protein [Strongyloides ratti]|uniref:Gp150 protein n=1 Tax=Strongyloides ratti TaxID=34506 RepID=A0A090LNT2_STRRB|nr:Gp150 protein [Strongyloides ratti]CEF71525.1 Gp150 protein [Strongyloides ratti]
MIKSYKQSSLFLIFILVIFKNTPTQECDYNNKSLTLICDGKMLNNDNQLIKVPDTIKNIKINDLKNKIEFNFTNKPFLWTVEIVNSNITILSETFWKNIQNVKNFSFRKNNITLIPQQIKYYTYLQKLNLKNNNISEITNSDVLFLSKIRIVDISRNQINKWPDYIYAITDPVPSLIEKLDLSQNNFSKLEINAFWHFPSLKYLNFSKNFINDITSGTFKQLKRLETLDLSYNNLYKIERQFFSDLVGLKKIYLNYNNISKISEAVFFLQKNLTILNISYNKLKSLDTQWTFELKNLEKLELSMNEISYIHPYFFSHCPNLLELNLNFNKLERLEYQYFGYLYKLKSFFVSHNYINYLDKALFNSMQELENLDVSENKLAFCLQDGLVLADLRMDSLKFLNFSSNRLEMLPPYSFKNFPNLSIIDLRSNPIVTIQANAFFGLNLTKLYFDSDKLNCDCGMRWFSKWLQVANLEDTKINAYCLHPIEFYNVDMLTLDFDNITCAEQTPYIQFVLQQPNLLKGIELYNSSITCSGYGAAPITVKWILYKENETIIVNENKVDNVEIVILNTPITNKTEFESMSTILHFINMTQNNEGQYQCILSNIYGPAYGTRTKVIVNRIPEFISSPDSIIVNEDQTIILNCEGKGKPDPIIKWSKGNNSHFPAASERRLHIQQNDEYFYILNAKKKDSGLYSCHIVNDAALITKTVMVLVKEKNNDISQNISLIDGQNCTLNCFNDTLDKYEWKNFFQIRWYYTPFEGNESKKLDEIDKRFIVIKNFIKKNEGLYSCNVYSNQNNFQFKKEFYLKVNETNIFNKNTWININFFTIKNSITLITIIIIIISIIGILIYSSYTIGKKFFVTKKRNERSCSLPETRTNERISFIKESDNG